MLRRIVGGLLWLLLLSFALRLSPAHAQIGSDRYAAIVMDAERGTVLTAASADEPRYPASLTKMMTLYLAFEALRDRRLALNTPIFVSAEAAAMPPSRVGLVAGGTLTAEEAMLAMITKSANDAAAALGEHLAGGSEHRFAQLMTLRARSLGMTRSTFRNASGLPDVEQVSTARDMAVLGRRLVQDFPERYALFSTPHFTFRGRTLWNHNRLLTEYDGTDGIKTGYVNDSGFNLVASTQRNGVRLVAAVFGGRTGRERDRHMMELLDTAFERMGVPPRAPVVAAVREPAPARRGFRVLGTAQAAARTPGRIAVVPVLAVVPPRGSVRGARVAQAAPVVAGRPIAATAGRAMRGRVEQGDSSRVTGRGQIRVAAAPRTLALPARLRTAGR